MEPIHAEESVAILVLGMHRSGTSAITRILNLLGAELGNDLLDAQSDNRHGFWEHTKAVEIHEALLTAIDRDWHDMREMPQGWLDHPASEHAIEAIMALVRSEFSNVRLWAVKDPRMCRLAPLWIRALERLNIRVAALIAVRDPHEVARSLHVREGWSYPHSYLMWLRHFIEAVRATENVPRSILSYDDLFVDWSATMLRVGEELQLQWPRSIEEARTDIESFINPSDRHHRADELAQGAPHEEIPPAALSDIFRLAVAVSDRKAGWSALHALDLQYSHPTSIFSYPIDELVTERNELKRLALERMTLIDQLVAHRHALTQGHETSVQQTNAALAEKDAALAEKDVALADKAAELALRDHQFQTLQASYADLAIQARELTDSKLRLAEEKETLEHGLHYYERRMKRAVALVNNRRWLLHKIWQRIFGLPDGKDEI